MSQTLKLITFNIHKGYSTGRLRYTLSHIKKALKTLECDLVFLQEVMGKPKSRKGEVNVQSQFETLADTIWPHYSYGKNAVYGDIHHGNATLSKYPIVYHTNVDLSTNRIEKRGLLHTSIEIKGLSKPLQCFNIHLNLFESGRMRQLILLEKYLQQTTSENEPFIIAGDFNDWTKKFSSHLEKKVKVKDLFASYHGKHAKTFPSRFPFLTLDRIYGHKMEPKIAKVLTGDVWKGLSDHSPIYIEVEVEK